MCVVMEFLDEFVFPVSHFYTRRFDLVRQYFVGGQILWAFADETLCNLLCFLYVGVLAGVHIVLLQWFDDVLEEVVIEFLERFD